LHALLGKVEVTEAPDERRGEPAGFFVENGGYRVARYGARC